MGDSEGERLARLEVKMDQVIADMRAHRQEHHDAKVDAQEAKDTAKQAALMVAVNQRSNKTAMRAAWVGGAIVVGVQVAQFALKVTGHG